MKKLAIGCGVIVVLLVVGITISCYVIANRAGSYLRESGVLESVQTLGKGVTNTAPFTPPANGELTPDVMGRFAAVEDAIVAKMGGRFRQIQAMQDDMLRQQRAEHRRSTPEEDAKNVTTMMGFVVQAQAAWIEALNQQRFSMEEFQWVRGRVWAASGLKVTELTSRNLSAALEQGAGATRQLGGSSERVPDRNTQLVAPYLPRMKDWAALAFFGL